MHKYDIEIFFLPNPKTGALFELKHVKLKTKKISRKRVEELAEIEIEKSGWPYVDATIRRIP